MTYILNIGVQTPQYRYAQNDLVSPLQSLYAPGTEAFRKTPVLMHKSAIDYRYSALADFNGHADDDAIYRFKRQPVELPDITERMRVYREKSLPLAEQTVLNMMAGAPQYGLDEITHIVTVSCTGLSAPGMEILLPERLGMKADLKRFAVNFMGCYGAMHGMKLADMICKTDPDALVLVVCVELCTLHLRHDATDDNLLSSSLFGDGAAAVLLSGKTDRSASALEIMDFKNAVIPKGSCDMEWQIGADGFQMKLTSEIPRHVEENLSAFYAEMLELNGVSPEEIAHYAIHPGGKRILEAFIKSLGIDKSALWASFYVLRMYGNMSSPSVLFVLKELWDKKVNRNENEHIFSAAFGPGLTVEAALLKHHFANA